MGKGKQGNVVSMPKTPESYFKSGRARELPVDECLISEDWQDGGIINIVLARKHVNGNISWAMFLVDTYCLGIRDTDYAFNQPEEDYIECKGLLLDGYDMIPCSYSLIHNLIFGAIAFAETYDFKPCKEFSVSCFLLKDKEDEPIKKMDIEFGFAGKPTYYGLHEDAHAERIIASLKRNPGEGNFMVIFEGDEDDEDDWDDEDLDDEGGDWDEDDRDDEGDDDDDDDSTALFGEGEMEEILSGKKNPNWFQTYVLADDVYDDYFPDEITAIGEMEEICMEFDDLVEKMNMDSSEYGADSDEIILRLASALPEAVAQHRGVAEADKLIGEYPNIYDLCQLRLLFSMREDFSSPETLFDGFYKRFPGRPLSKILRCGHLISLGEPEKGFDVLGRKRHMTEAFPENEGIFSWVEILSYCAVMCRYYAAVDDLINSRLFAGCIIEFSDPDELCTTLAIRELTEKMRIKIDAKMEENNSRKD
ncbi:MAG TPA: hypothetical protein VFX43_16700 [Chitinophagaceae bacterium]|nr:hypothetical protein [Chitinophagaceae bacterium]